MMKGEYKMLRVAHKNAFELAKEKEKLCIESRSPKSLSYQ